MIVRPWSRRSVLAAGAAACLAGPAAQAQATAIKIQLDWRFEGPSALFLLPVATGLFRAENLNVNVEAGNGSGNAILRVASGTHELGFADMAALMEFHANNPGATNKPVAVMMVYNTSPAAVISLKKRGLNTPADLTGKNLGAPMQDAGRRAFALFQKANGVGPVNWVSMEPALREAMLVRGDVDAITGFYFTSVVGLEARGVKLEDLAVQMYADHGVKLYGNAIIASQELIKTNPEAVRAFLRAFTKGARQVLRDPKAALAHVKQRDSGINAELEERRLRLAIASVIATPDAKAEGFGAVSATRLTQMAHQVADAYGTHHEIHPESVWNAGFLPSTTDRDIFSSTMLTGNPSK